MKYSNNVDTATFVPCRYSKSCLEKVRVLATGHGRDSSTSQWTWRMLATIWWMGLRIMARQTSGLTWHLQCSELMMGSTMNLPSMTMIQTGCPLLILALTLKSIWRAGAVGRQASTVKHRLHSVYQTIRVREFDSIWILTRCWMSEWLKAPRVCSFCIQNSYTLISCKLRCSSSRGIMMVWNLVTLEQTRHSFKLATWYWENPLGQREANNDLRISSSQCFLSETYCQVFRASKPIFQSRICSGPSEVWKHCRSLCSIHPVILPRLK